MTNAGLPFPVALAAAAALSAAVGFVVGLPAPGQAEKYVGLVTSLTNSPAEIMAGLAVAPTLRAGILIDAFASNLLGSGTAALCDVADSLKQTAKQVQGGDLAALEAMLLCQATSLDVF